MNSRIRFAIEEAKARGEVAIVTFVTAGDPSLSELPQILSALAEGGADIIEVGLPFSDPIADGPTIQASSQRALDRGVKTHQIFEVLRGFVGPPLVFMGYMNPIVKMGMETFAQKVKEAGGAGVIICDLSPDEATEWISIAKKYEVDTIFLAAPTSTDERLELIAQSATGFIYALSRLGVTGTESSHEVGATDLVSRLRARSDTPVCVGFGIHTPEQVQSIREYSDGVIIGSVIVDFLAKNWESGKGKQDLINMIRRFKTATMSWIS